MKTALPRRILSTSAEIFRTQAGPNFFEERYTLEGVVNCSYDTEVVCLFIYSSVIQILLILMIHRTFGEMWLVSWVQKPFLDWRTKKLKRKKCVEIDEKMRRTARDGGQCSLMAPECNSGCICKQRPTIPSNSLHVFIFFTQWVREIGVSRWYSGRYFLCSLLCVE